MPKSRYAWRRGLSIAVAVLIFIVGVMPLSYYAFPIGGNVGVTVTAETAILSEHQAFIGGSIMLGGVAVVAMLCIARLVQRALLRLLSRE